ncbi:MAG: hypothetical protein H6573_32960 [Lewinellaceae bacterium]|nr:hypothetical protein [Lewinellaceae bacterium]
MDEEKELLEGFNAGYLIEKHRPELAQQLVKSVEGVELSFIEGFVAGSQEYAKERTRSKIISKLRDSTGISKPTPTKDKDDKDKGFEIDI